MQAISTLILVALYISTSHAMIGSMPRNTPISDPPKGKKRGKDKECCQLNKGFDFEGTACVISGDPHFTMFNGGKHDFQGQPMVTTTDGNYKDAFYYVSRCAGKTVDDLPFQILGTQYYGKKVFFTRTSVTLVDYLTFELNDQDGTLYYMYFSSQFRAYAKASTDGVDVSYDKTLADAPSALVTIEKGTTTQIGDTFSVIFATNAKTATATDMTMTVSFYDNDGLETADVFVQMRGITGAANNDPYTPYSDRDRYYHSLYIDLDDEWKCGACGMCGQFKNNPSNSAQMIQTCDGQWMEVVDGWSGIEAVVDENGWTFEYNYYNKQCASKGANYDMKKGGKKNGGAAKMENECPAWKQKIVKNKCNAAMKLNKIKTCCAKVGSTECNRLKRDCYEDACLMSGDSKASIQKQVNGGLIDEIMDLCNVKNVEKKMKNQNLLPFNDVEYSQFGERDYGFDDDEEPQNDPFDGLFDDNEDIINDMFNKQPQAFNPMQQPQAPSNYVLSLTATDLLIVALVAANIVVLAMVIYCVCSKYNKPRRYVSVKTVADTEDDEECQFVQ